MESNRMNRVYLDHNASTPVHPEVLAEMLPYFAEVFGNPSSIHAFGREARDGLDRARERVARFLRVSPEVNTISCGETRRKRATRSRARSRPSRASRPKAWMLDGLPKTSAKYGSISARTSGWTGVDAL